MLYVLDEPTAGLHPHDVDHLRAAIDRLAERGYTVVIVEHEESMIRAADEVIEIGREPAKQVDVWCFKAHRHNCSRAPQASLAISDRTSRSNLDRSYSTNDQALFDTVRS